MGQRGVAAVIDRPPLKSGRVSTRYTRSSAAGFGTARQRKTGPSLHLRPGRHYGRMDDRLHLRLVPLDLHNWRASLAVEVLADQLRFVAGYRPVALVILAKAYVRPGDLDWEPLALITKGSVVGVVALAHSPTRTELLHLAIDADTQGRGLGSAAMALVLAHISQTRPDCEEVSLTVHPENERGQRLYRRSGLLPNGQVRDGEPVWLLNIQRDGRPSGTGEG